MSVEIIKWLKDIYSYIYLSYSKLSDIYSRLDISLSSRLDISLSSLRDSLKPDRSSPSRDLSSETIASGSTTEVIKSGLGGYSAIICSVRPTYDASATAGVRVRWLYSPDGTNYDTTDGAENEGYYQDLTFTAGTTVQETVIIPVLAPYTKIQIVNLDSSVSVTVDEWSWLLR